MTKQEEELLANNLVTFSTIKEMFKYLDENYEMDIKLGVISRPVFVKSVVVALSKLGLKRKK